MPSDKVGRRVTVDVQEGRAATFVLANYIVGSVDLNSASPVGVKVLAVGLRTWRDMLASCFSAYCLCSKQFQGRTAVQLPPGTISSEALTGESEPASMASR